MKKILYLLAICLLATMVTVIVPLGCAQAPTPTPSPSPGPSPTPSPKPTPTPTPKLPDRLVFQTLRPGTSQYANILGLTQTINQYTDIKVIMQPYPSSRDIYPHMKANDIQLATTGFDAITAYFWGKPTVMAPDAKESNLFIRLLMLGNDTYFAWHTRGDTGIKAIPDLKGHKVSFVIPGLGSTQTLAEDQLKAFGLDPEKDVVSVPLADLTAQSDALMNKKVDAIFSSIGGAKTAELEARYGAVILPFPKDKINTLRSYQISPEGYEVVVLPAGYYSGAIKEPTPVVGKTLVLLTREDLSDDAAYLVVKVIAEHAAELGSVAFELSEWTKERAVPPPIFTVPFHTGAIKYFKELGKWTAAHEAQQTKLLDEVKKATK